MKRLIAVAATVALLAGSLAGCTGSSSGGSGGSGKGGKPIDGPDILRVLASSEVADLEKAGVLEELHKATGVRVVLSESGTLDASSDIASGEAVKSADASWLASNRYLSLLEGADKQVATSTKIMASPVVLGVRPAAMQRLGWNPDKPPSWAQISQAVADKKLSYAMTNPAASNSGFSALVAVTTGLAGGGAALDHDRTQAVTPQLKTFFAGQKITAGSTGWITDKFLADPDCDALFSYEASLLSHNDATPNDTLTLVTPSDGVVTADYPLSFLAGASAEKRALYDKAVEWLRSAPAQQLIMERTARRPLAGGVRPDARFGDRTLVDLPFPSQRQVVDDLLSTYMNKVRRPAVTVYVLDVSGSMEGNRLAALKSAMGGLTNPTAGNSFTSFHARETVVLLPFSSGVKSPRQFQIPENAPEATLGQIGSAVNGLDANGSTYLYEALEEAYRILPTYARGVDGAYSTVVVLTDGEANGSKRISDFRTFYEGLPAEQRVPTFTIRFGEASVKDMKEIAEITGGRSFDGTGNLTAAFRTIRGYQ